MRTRGKLIGVLGLVAGLVGAVPAAWAGDGDAIAFVNGQPISKQRLMDVLLDAHGLQVLQQLIVLDLAKQETRRLGLRVTQGDIDREYQQALQHITPQTDRAGARLSEAEQQMVLDQLLAERGLSRAEFMLGMERNAHLRKIVEREFRIDEPTLREEFARVYGEKVEVRLIQVNTIEGLHEALNLLTNDTDFAEVARRVSQDRESAQAGGRRAPFAFNDPDVAPVLREAAFALKPGERTPPIKVANNWFILQLLQRIAPQEARFEDVRDQVAAGMRERVVPERMNTLVTELFHQAEIKVLDRELKKKFEELLKSNAATGAPPAP